MEFNDRDPDLLTDFEKYGEQREEDVIDKEEETGRVVVTGELENVQTYAWLEGDSFFFILLTGAALLATLIFMCCCAWLILRKAEPIQSSKGKIRNTKGGFSPRKIDKNLKRAEAKGSMFMVNEAGQVKVTPIQKEGEKIVLPVNQDQQWYEQNEAMTQIRKE